MDTELKTEFRVDDEINLRAWRETDLDIALEIVLRNRDHLRTFMRWMTPDYSADSAKKFITEGIINRLQRKNLGLGIFRNDTLIGSIGFVHFDWDAGKTEIGYWIDKNEEGKGVITRACRTLIEYAFDDLSMHRVEIRCAEDNIRSGAIPERLGFMKEGTLRRAEMIHGKLHDFNIYSLLADDRRLW